MMAMVYLQKVSVFYKNYHTYLYIMNLAKIIVSTIFMVCFSNLLWAQQPSSSNNNIRVSTKTTALLSLEEQIVLLENQLEEAAQNPSMVADGTVAKYEQVLLQKRAALKAEQEERESWEAKMKANQAANSEE